MNNLLRRVFGLSVTGALCAALSAACQSDSQSEADGDSGAGGGSGGSAGSDDSGATETGGNPGSGGSDPDPPPECSAVGVPCCDPYPSDGPNYCMGDLVCGADSTCVMGCDCALGAYIPVCGVDGQTYDATCGRDCVSVEIACDGECPCQCIVEAGTGCGLVDSGAECCDGLHCCTGVPYDAAGECRPECDLR
jgi:hypothetical protein